jgi:RNase P/RNase MRP subunit p29
MKMQELIGKLIKVVLADSKDELKTLKGRLISFDNDFIELETYTRTYHLGRRYIVKLHEIIGE